MNKKWKNGKMGSGSKGSVGGAYFLGMIGAAVYYLNVSTGFWPSITALLKALVWPAFLVYHLLSL
jgi:hypothetical protein